MGYSSQGTIDGFTQINAGTQNEGSSLLISPQIGLDCWDAFAGGLGMPSAGMPSEHGGTGHDSDKSDEVVRPDYYAVTLDRFGIRVQVTATEHVAIYRFTYPQSDHPQASVVIYPSHAQRRPAPVFASVRFNPALGVLTGRLDAESVILPRVRKYYYAACFSAKTRSFGVFDNELRQIKEGESELAKAGAGFFARFDMPETRTVYVKVAISTKSGAKAAEFLKSEIPDWDFDRVQSGAAETWNAALSSILIDDPEISDDEKTIFYTALYHVLLSPQNRTGDCPWDYNGPYYDEEHCVWDTFRTKFPLLTLIRQGAVRDNVRSYCEVFRHFGYAADALFGGQEDFAQGGDDVDVLVADAYAKGVPGIDWTASYNLLKGHATMSGRSALYRADDRGWVPYGTLPLFQLGNVFLEPPNVVQLSGGADSKTLEFAYNDFCLARVAEGMGHDEDARRFLTRSGQWVNLWNSQAGSDGFHGFIQSKDIDGDWVPFDPAKTNTSMSPDLYEGSSWTYSYFVPHQMSKLIALMGGKENFIQRLHHYIARRLEMYNEPCFLAPYLFNYVSRPDLTSAAIRRINTAYFSRAGYPGDDDSGAMSSWLIFSKLGVFPVAGQDVYLLFGPRYQKVTIQMENGKRIVIYGKGASQEAAFVKSAMNNGVALDRAWIRHGDLRGGAVLDFTMSPTPTAWTWDAAAPPSY
jgi:predicted alpha-1,2-mannosidase